MQSMLSPFHYMKLQKKFSQEDYYFCILGPEVYFSYHPVIHSLMHAHSGAVHRKLICSDQLVTTKQKHSRTPTYIVSHLFQFSICFSLYLSTAVMH